MRYFLFFILGVTLVQCQEGQWRNLLKMGTRKIANAFYYLRDTGPEKMERIFRSLARNDMPISTWNEGQWREDTLNGVKASMKNWMNDIKAKTQTVDEEFLEKFKVEAKDVISEIESRVANFDKDSLDALMTTLKFYSDQFDSKLSDKDSTRIQTYNLRIRNGLYNINRKMAKIDFSESKLQESKATVAEWIVSIENWLDTFKEDGVEEVIAKKAYWMGKVENAVGEEDLDKFKTHVLNWCSDMREKVEGVSSETVEVYKAKISECLDFNMDTVDTKMVEDSVANVVQWMDNSKTQIDEIGLCAWKTEQISTMRQMVEKATAKVS